MRRALAFSLLVACAVAGILSAALLAATPSTTADETTTGTTTTAPPPPPTTTAPTTTTPTTTTPTVPRPTTIAAGVTVGGAVLVGGLSPAEATAAVKTFFARPLTLKLGKVTLRATPRQLGASAYVGDAIRRARVAFPGANVPLKVAAPQPRIERYVRGLATRFDRAPVDSKLLLRNAKPFVTKEEPGRRLRQVLVVRELFRRLLEQRHLVAAGTAPGGPEVEHDDLPAQRLERQVSLPVQPLEREGGGLRGAAALQLLRHLAVALGDLPDQEAQQRDHDGDGGGLRAEPQTPTHRTM